MFTNLTSHTLSGSDRANEIDPIRAHQEQERVAPSGRPYVYTNMVSSMDGAIAIDGVSGALGGPADFEVFMALRSVADVILVGAGTARDEQYKPPTAREASLPYRRDRGQAPRPALAVVTRSGKLSTELPMFNDPDLPPLVICGTAAEQDALKELEGVADIAQVPTESVSPDQALEVLHQRGHQLVLLEGGPSLNGTFTEADLIDEWNLTLSPLLVGGTSGRATKSHNASKREFSPSHVWSAEGLLFLQWLRSSEPAQN